MFTCNNMSLNNIVLWCATIFTTLSRFTNGYHRSQQLYQDLISTIDKYHSLKLFADQLREQHYLLPQYYYPAEENNSLQYLEPSSNQLPLKTNTLHSSIPLAVTVPTSLKTYTVYFPNSHPVQPPTQVITLLLSHFLFSNHGMYFYFKSGDKCSTKF